MAIKFSKSFGLFLIVGMANTVLTFLVIMTLYFLNFSDEGANFFGIAAGVAQSIILNSKFTFNQKTITAQKSLWFFLILVASYLINFAMLNFLLYVMNFPSLISQLISISFYVLVSYILLNNFLFKGVGTKLE